MATELVGIVNVTPESFSDGGSAFACADALAAIARLIGEGAGVIDIGAESTRPGATPLSQEEEWMRLEPVLTELEEFAGGPVEFSLDTRHAKTAAQALEYGIDWINDVSGFFSPIMIDAVKSSDCKCVVMHSLSVPADRNIVMDENADVVETLLSWAKARIAFLEKNGIDRRRIIFDPGIGFSKTAAQSWAIINSVTHFRKLGVPLFIGHSRKSFLLSPSPQREEGAAAGRDLATLAVSRELIAAGVDYLRVHDVAAHRVLLEAAPA